MKLLGRGVGTENQRVVKIELASIWPGVGLRLRGNVFLKTRTIGRK